MHSPDASNVPFSLSLSLLSSTPGYNENVTNENGSARNSKSISIPIQITVSNVRLLYRVLCQNTRTTSVTWGMKSSHAQDTLPALSVSSPTNQPVFQANAELLGCSAHPSPSATSLPSSSAPGILN